MTEQPATISREWGRRRTVMACNPATEDVAGFVAEARKRVEERVKLPPGYRVEWGGSFENLQRFQSRMVIVVPLALLSIFVLLYLSFHSLTDAARVFLGVPFAAVGGVVALVVRDLPFSVSAGVGFIALSGVSVLNSLLLVTSIRHIRELGVPVRQAVRQAVQERVRPVLMTALVASLGVVPMAVSSGMGAEVQRPLATVVIGGVVSSTLLTLLVLPAIYVLFDGGGLLLGMIHLRRRLAISAPHHQELLQGEAGAAPQVTVGLNGFAPGTSGLSVGTSPPDTTDRTGNVSITE